MTIGAKKIALIHVARQKTGMTEPEYRDLLASVGVTSSKDLDPRRFVAVMNRFRDLGFRSINARPDAAGSGKAAQIAKIDALLAGAGLTRRYADGIANRMFGVQRLAWLDGRQLRSVTAALVYQNGRQRTADGRKGRG